jgi:hypothetical protein
VQKNPAAFAFFHFMNKGRVQVIPFGGSQPGEHGVFFLGK